MHALHGVDPQVSQEPPPTGRESPGSELDRKMPPRVRKPLPRNDQWKAPTPETKMKQQRISGKEAARVAEDMAKPGPIRVVAASEAQEAPGALVPSPGSELDRKMPPRVRKPLPRNWGAVADQGGYRPAGSHTRVHSGPNPVRPGYRGGREYRTGGHLWGLPTLVIAAHNATME